MKNLRFENSMRSLHRAVSILNAFSLDEPELSAADIAWRVGIPKTTAYRIVTYLFSVGFLERNVDTGRYMIGGGLFSIATLYLNTTDFLKAAEPVMKTLNELTNEAVNLGIYDKGKVTVVMKEESKHAFRFSIHIGSVVPAYASALGKAFLSELTEAELDMIYRDEKLKALTENTIVTKTELKQELEQVRLSGVAFDKAEDYEGIEGIGSVIRDVSGKTVAAISISVPNFRINQALRKRIAELLRMASRLISYRLGYRENGAPVPDVKEISSWWEQNKADS
jgi:DNA-binding IclR family transcriptional regulator